MTQKKSSDEEVKIEGEPELDVQVEGEEIVADKPITQESKPITQEPDDADALRKQIDELKKAQVLSQQRAAQAEEWAQQQAEAYSNMRGYAEQSQYDSIMTAMGAAQIEVDAAKRDIVMAGAAQDYEALANAQESLATAKARMVRLEEGKDNYEAQRTNREQKQPQQYAGDPVVSAIDQNANLYQSEKDWLKSHLDAMKDPKQNAKLNNAYYAAEDQGLTRNTKEYFDFIDTSMGYREAPKVQKPAEEESSAMMAAPPSRESRGPGGGQTKTSVTLTREEAEIAKLSGITPAEYAKQKVILQEQQRTRPGDYPKG